MDRRRFLESAGAAALAFALPSGGALAATSSGIEDKFAIIDQAWDYVKRLMYNVLVRDRLLGLEPHNLTTLPEVKQDIESSGNGEIPERAELLLKIRTLLIAKTSGDDPYEHRRLWDILVFRHYYNALDYVNNGHLVDLRRILWELENDLV